MVRIFLTGYMGAGKTTLGKAFARKLNVPFIDLTGISKNVFIKLSENYSRNGGKPDFESWKEICFMR